MLKYAFIALATLIVGLIAVSLLPERERAVPDSTIELSDARLTLYPQADPEAVWNFSAPNVEYDPDLRETTLLNVEDGKRVESGETDFTLQSERTTIDSEDNLRSERFDVYLLEEQWDMDMEARDGQPVTIRQQEGVFEIPHLVYREISQDELEKEANGGPENDVGENINQNVTISFDLTTFSSGGEGTVGITEFELDDRNSDGE